jgi:hypothetical protein
MKHPHTRAAVKQSFQDFGGIFKATGKWAKSTFVGIPKAIGEDKRINRATIQIAEKLQQGQITIVEAPADAQ